MRPGARYMAGMLAALGAALLTAGCAWEPTPPPPAPPAERVFIMYDNINDDIRRPFTANVNAAGRSVAAGALDPGERVVVFQRRYSVPGEPADRSVVYELVADASQADGFRREVLRVYGEGEHTALDVATINSVVGDIRGAVPAPHYGLAFGSHGSGWIPRSNQVPFSRADASPGEAPPHPYADLWEVPENSPTRAFQGYGQNLDVAEFIDALDEWQWDFILLDDCFMASVEALYDMRTLAGYIIASPTEILIEGFPYDKVVESVFADWSETGFVRVGREFVDYYRSKTGDGASATVAVVKTPELDALAETVRRLNPNLNELISAAGIQHYEGITRPGHIFYDLDDYLSRIRGSTAPTEYNAFREQLDRTVVFKDHTGRFFTRYPYPFGSYVTVNSFSGLAVFIPWSETEAFVPDYRRTAWYEYVYGGN